MRAILFERMRPIDPPQCESIGRFRGVFWSGYSIPAAINVKDCYVPLTLGFGRGIAHRRCGGPGGGFSALPVRIRPDRPRDAQAGENRAGVGRYGATWGDRSP